MSRRRNRRPKPTTDVRTPDERLEAFAREKNLERAERMLVRIADDLDGGEDPAPWIAAARTLSERLIISDDAFHFLTDVFTESILLDASTTDPERAEEVVAAFLRTAGHADVAELYESNHTEFERRVAAGADDIWGHAEDEE
jgi:hypothetical protein